MGSVTDTKGHHVVVPKPTTKVPIPSDMAGPKRVPYRRPGPSPIGVIAILVGMMVMAAGFMTGGNLVVVGIGLAFALAGGATRAPEKQKRCEHCTFPIPWDARVCGHCTREVV